jgi:hypothetical protein
MKSLYYKITAFSIFVLMFASCKKDETKVVAGVGTAPVLTATKNALVLTKADSAGTATVFNWTKSSFGYNAAVTYTLQMDLAGNNFKAPVEVDLEAGLTKSYNVYELNSALVLLGLKPGVAGQVEVRTKATINDTYAPAYSNVLSVTATTFLVEINYPSLWVPGGYQGWVPATAAKVSSVANDGVYEGYAYFPDATTEFKFTSAPDFTHINYGTSAAGTLNAGGGDNLKVTGAGYYLLKANTKLLTYSAVKTSWAVIGNATGSWDVETPMTFDVANKVWTITKALTAGELKFRANNAYDINFGSNTPADGKLVYNGSNIPVATAGNYKITMNVSVPGNYTYSIVKQ